MNNTDETSSLLTKNSVHTTSVSVNDPDSDDKTLEQRYQEYNMSLPKLPILVSLWMGSFLSALDGTVVANIMNGVAEEFEESDRKQWIATSFLLTNTAFQPLYGKLSDITGRKFALLTAQFFFGLGCLLTCFATNVTQFSIARAICGIGGGGINASSSIAVSDICTTRERGVYQGYANIVFGMGQLLGAPIGGFLMGTIGWRAVFGIQVPLIIVCSILAKRNINIKLTHVPPRSERFTWKNLSRIDLAGSISLVSTISGVLFLTSTNWNKVLLSIFTLLSFIVFILMELYVAKERIVPFELLKGSFGLSSIATVCSSFIIYGDIFRSPIYLQIVQDISVTTTGFYLILPSAVTALSSVVTGSIIRNTKMSLPHCTSKLIFFSFVIQLIGLSMAYYLLAHLNPSVPLTNSISELTKTFFSKEALEFSSTSYYWTFIYISASCIVSYGYASLLVATLVSIVFSIDKKQQGTVTGIFYLWRSIGNVLGASLTLVAFEKTLANKLWQFMFEIGSDSYQFTKKDYHRLITDSSYLRGGSFPVETLAELLSVYVKAFLMSYWPNIFLTIVGIAVTSVLYRMHSRKLTLNSDC